MLRLKILSKFNQLLKKLSIFLQIANAMEYTFVEFLINANTRSLLWGSHDEGNTLMDWIPLHLCQAVTYQAGQWAITQKTWG